MDLIALAFAQAGNQFSVVNRQLEDIIRSASSYDALVSNLISSRLEGAAAIEENIAAAIFNVHLLGRSQVLADVRQNARQPTSRARARDLSFSAIVLEPDFEPLPFDEAITFFRNKTNLTPQQFQALTQAARTKAFTVADGANRVVRDSIREMLDGALADGLTLREFQDNAADVLDATGVSPRTPWYWETVYRTNGASSYQVGRWKQMSDPDVVAERPFLRYVSARLPNSRPDHIDKHGLVYPVTDAFWQTWYPPNGFNCFCTVMSVSESALRRSGWSVSTRRITEEPDAGFRVNAGMSDQI